MTKPTLCIYHGKCADGFTAAWAVWKSGVDATFFPGVYQEPPPDVDGLDVVLVDFSYKRAAMDDIIRRANSVKILDHHKSAIEDLDGIDGCETVFDIDRSGASIAWDYYHPGTPRPNLVKYVEDRDLWRFKLPLSREVNAYIFAHEYTFGNWDHLERQTRDHMGVQMVADMGAAIERKHHKDVRELVDVCKRRLRIGGHEVWAASIPYTLTSDAGNLMSEGEPFAACYWDTPKGRVFSLRSKPDGADVSEIAKQYGGGGHKNASGFRVPLDQIGQFEIAD